MKINNTALKFYNINETCTVSDCRIKNRRLLKLVGRYDLSLLFEALTRLDLKNNTKNVRLYYYLGNSRNNCPLLILENENRIKSGVVVAPKEMI